MLPVDSFSCPHAHAPGFIDAEVYNVTGEYSAARSWCLTFKECHIIDHDCTFNFQSTVEKTIHAYKGKHPADESKISEVKRIQIDADLARRICLLARGNKLGNKESNELFSAVVDSEILNFEVFPDSNLHLL